MRENIDDHALQRAIKRAEEGLVDADLGGNLLKIRIAKRGQGRSSGYRTLVAYKKNKKAFFLYGFAKSERENIDNAELMSLKELASTWINSSDAEINHALSQGFLTEVDDETSIEIDRIHPRNSQ